MRLLMGSALESRQSTNGVKLLLSSTTTGRASPVGTWRRYSNPLCVVRISGTKGPAASVSALRLHAISFKAMVAISFYGTGRRAVCVSLSRFTAPRFCKCRRPKTPKLRHKNFALTPIGLEAWAWALALPPIVTETGAGILHANVLSDEAAKFRFDLRTSPNSVAADLRPIASSDLRQVIIFTIWRSDILAAIDLGPPFASDS